MRHIKQADIGGVQKAPHQAKWRKTLRQALQNPGITDEQRAAIKQKLSDVAQGKDYSVRTPNPGGIDPDVSPVGILHRKVLPSLKALSRMKKPELVALARSLGVPVPKSATKAAIISTIEERSK